MRYFMCLGNCFAFFRSSNIASQVSLLLLRLFNGLFCLRKPDNTLDLIGSFSPSHVVSCCCWQLLFLFLSQTLLSSIKLDDKENCSLLGNGMIRFIKLQLHKKNSINILQEYFGTNSHCVWENLIFCNWKWMN